MKKNFLKAMALVLSMLFVLSAFAGCAKPGEQGPAGAQGEAGLDGKSAYELAVENGYTGTVEEWLSSLIGNNGADGKNGADGQDGKNGADGKSAYELAVEKGYTGTMEEWLSSLIGEKGEKGDKGATGNKGDTGAQGPKGEKGEQGEKGETGAQGVGIAGAHIDENMHLILELDDGSEIDAGYVGVTTGEPTVQIHTVTFDVGNFDVTNSPVAQHIENGKIVTKPEDPIRQDYIFSGWYLDTEHLNAYDFESQVTDDLILFAKWIPISSDTIVLTSNKSSVLITQDEKIYLYASTGLTVESLDLYAENEFIAKMYDDGNFDEHGDDMAGDGIYSACVSLIVSTDTIVSYKASHETNISNGVTINYYTEISESTLMSINAVASAIDEIILNEAFENKTDEEKKSLIENALLDLENSNHIVEGSINFNENAKLFSFQYAEGILGGITCENYTDELNGGYNRENTNDSEMQNSKVLLMSSNDTKEISSIGTAIILNSFPSFETEQDNIDYRTSFYERVKSEWDQMGLATTLDTDVTISDYQNIDDYNVICISTHGSVYSWRDGFLWLSYHEMPAFCLSEQATETKNSLYSKELKDKQIAIVNGRYWILPGFFTNNFAENAFVNSFVFSESCQSYGKGMKYNYSMADAFINLSAKDYIGFHNSVLATYSREFMETYVDQLIDGNTTTNAYQTAVNTYGSNHEIWFNANSSYTWKEYIEKYQENPRTYNAKLDIAYVVRQGNNADATLIQSGLKNGNFDSYDTITSVPKFWDVEGDVRTILKLGDVVSENQRMSIITTGVGSKTTATIGVGTEGSIIKQTFIVPDTVSLLSFDYNLVSEEPMEYVGSQYNDAFGIQLIQDGSVVYQTIYEDINSSEWFAVNGIDFADGDDTVYHTGWKSAQLDISEYQGKVITLCFVIYDVGDSLYDSACVIDNIQLQ